jgi:hypothetical protein
MLHSLVNLLHAVFFAFKNKQNSDAGASGATRRVPTGRAKELAFFDIKRYQNSLY